MNECVDHMLGVVQQSTTTVAAEDPLKGEGLRQAAATGDSDKVRDLMANNEPVDAQDAVSINRDLVRPVILSLFPKSRRAEEERLFPTFTVGWSEIHVMTTPSLIYSLVYSPKCTTG
jgi:hypothetical protein